MNHLCARGLAREGKILVAKEPLVIIAERRQRSPDKSLREAQEGCSQCESAGDVVLLGGFGRCFVMYV
ncbi:MAG: hypothetical protein O3C60_01045 [Planctomycetota bacterium]|nr:hypothetical protein [Planctomycetota bacterium]